MSEYPERQQDKDDGPGQPPSEENPPPLGNGQGQRWQLFIALSLGILLAMYYLEVVQQPERLELRYSELLTAVERGHVDEVTLRGQEIVGRLSSRGRSEYGVDEPGIFESTRPDFVDERLLPLLAEHDVNITAEPADPAWWQQILVGALPWILLLGLLFWFWHRMAQRTMSGSGALGFGKSGAKRVQRQDSKTRLDDVAGADQAKQEIAEVIEFLKHPGYFQRLGATIPRGVLMMGPPGTGKTLMARAIAGEAGVPFFTISASEFIEMFVGVGASRVRDLFRQAKEAAPAVIFIDELDSVGRSRGTGMGGGHDEREQTLNQILAEMDGFEGHESVVVLAATNRPDVLDPALLRPGRFDRKITLEVPHRQARVAILAVHTRKMPLADDVDLERIAAGTVGFSGADLANLANEAALLAGRRKLDTIDQSCFDDARDRIMLGAASERMLSERDRRTVACHEAGHALLAHLLPHADPLEKVSVLPRGRSLGITAQLPNEERYNFNESYLRDRLAVMFGGRAAESIVFGEVSSGAENDLEQATRLARRMVAHWGMSERVGPVAFPQSEEHVFLGKEIARGREHSEDTAALIDSEVRRLLGEVEAHARTTLEDNRQALDTLAEALLEHETLNAKEIRRLLDGIGLEANTARQPVATLPARA